ncbi:MAG: SPOR domain-containing protein [Alphaproteobacteria bacterium HGW-Alphaproteobacteria-1]|nr:MAG: SPOR domain-containing protein [Alphaproteobacteria bacterium HGW-Alphaproteobacteria-1]
MADFHVSGGTPVDGPRRASMAGLMNMTGAVISLALIGGIGTWGYGMVMRDVSGVPVVRALDGPMREAPEEPGGSPAAHQGLAVNEVAGNGTAAPPPDQVIIAPQPIDLTVEDALARAPSPARITPAPRPQPADVHLAVVREEAVEVAPAPETAPVRMAAVSGGLGQSLRPRTRPATADPVAFALAAATSATAAEVEPDSLPLGTRLAQLGAFESAEVARAEWDRLSTRLGDLLDGKSRVVQRAESGGRTFYRLRAVGFEDLADARRFCSALQAEKAECIPVVTR